MIWMSRTQGVMQLHSKTTQEVVRMSRTQRIIRIYFPCNSWNMGVFDGCIIHHADINNFLKNDCIWQIPLRLLHPEIRLIQKLKFLGTNWNSTKISIWTYIREIWVSALGGFWGCSNLGGNCHNSFKCLHQDHDACVIRFFFVWMSRIQSKRPMLHESLWCMYDHSSEQN